MRVDFLWIYVSMTYDVRWRRLTYNVCLPGPHPASGGRPTPFRWEKTRNGRTKDDFKKRKQRFPKGEKVIEKNKNYIDDHWSWMIHFFQKAIKRWESWTPKWWICISICKNFRWKYRSIGCVPCRQLGNRHILRLAYRISYESTVWLANFHMK